MFLIKLQLKNGKDTNIDLELSSGSKQVELTKNGVQKIKEHITSILSIAGTSTFALMEEQDHDQN